MVDGGVRCFSAAQRPTWMTFLSAGLFAGGFAQAPRAWRLLQSIAGRRFAAVGAVQAEAAFQFRDAGRLSRDDIPLRTVLFQQRVDLFPQRGDDFPQCGDDFPQCRGLAGRRTKTSPRMGIGRRQQHGKLDSCRDS
jgi:hypothetical protein